MFGHWYRDEFAFANLRETVKRLARGETTTLWAAIPSIPTFEAYSAELEVGSERRTLQSVKCKVYIVQFTPRD